ncbi:MAG: DUF72 domain-containing protein [bacterium]|nr:DUF72 domain-containing protein [bacterium]
MILIGCCGWGYLRIPKELKGSFKSVLSYYASLFNLVEVNSTFYSIPRLSTAKKWREEVGTDFLFTVKASRIITHIDRFSSEKSLELISFYIDFSRELNTPILLFQLPLTFPRKSMDDLIRVLKNFRDTRIKFALEARNLNIYERDEFSKITGTIPVIDPFMVLDSNFRPSPMFDTFYFRLHGAPPGKVIYRYDYTDGDLQRLLFYLEPIKDYNVYVLFNNTEMYKNALRFKGMVS